MAEQLRAAAPLPQGSSLVPSTHRRLLTTASLQLQLQGIQCLWPLQQPHQHIRTHTHTHTHTHTATHTQTPTHTLIQSLRHAYTYTHRYRHTQRRNHNVEEHTVLVDFVLFFVVLGFESRPLQIRGKHHQLYLPALYRGVLCTLSTPHPTPSCFVHKSF